jgi:hypothetical protein
MSMSKPEVPEGAPAAISMRFIMGREIEFLYLVQPILPNNGSYNLRSLWLSLQSSHLKTAGAVRTTYRIKQTLGDHVMAKLLFLDFDEQFETSRDRRWVGGSFAKKADIANTSICQYYNHGLA